MKIGAKEAVIEDLTITDTLILPADIVLSDVIIANQTNVGEVNIGCLDNSSFNLQTATNGNNGEVLKTDGNGLCYWGTNSGPGSGITFNGTTPIAETGHHTTISVDGLGLNLSKLIENSTELDMGALDIKNADVITCNDIETDDYFSLNQELQKINNLGPSSTGLTDVIGTLEADSVSANYVFNKDNGTNFIEMPNNQDAIKVYTTDFLFNGEQVATIDDIPEPQTFQEVYDNSSTPAIITMTSTKNINYTRNDNPILTLDSFNYKLTTQDISVAQITSNNYFPPDSGGLNNWSLSPYNFTASASSLINIFHEPGTSFAYIAEISTDGWISDNNKYDLTTGVATTSISTLVNGSPVIGEWLQLFTSIAVAINGFYYGGISDTSENNTAVDFQLVGSNDGVNFTLLSTQTAQNIIYPGEQYTTPTTIAYKYFRFIIQSIIPNNLNGRCAVGSGTAFDIILANPAKIRLLDDAVEIDGTYLTANNFIKSGGNSSQYLMADGSTTAISSIGSNIYLYSFSNITTTPPPNGRLRFDDNTLLSSVSNVYISHITSNNIDIDPFFISIQTNNILYIQHTTLSTEWIKFTITAEPNITPENFISIPVSLLGNGTFNPPSNIFLNNTDIYFSIFSSTATTNPFNQSLNTTDDVIFNNVSLAGILSSNTLAPLFGDTISILNNKAMTTTKTTFTNNQEFITKLYVDTRPPLNPFDQTLNEADQVIFQGITSFSSTATLKFTELYPKTPNDLNIGTLNTAILRLGGEGIFLSSGNILGVNSVSTNSLSPKTGDTISLSTNTAMTTTKTTFTNNQEFIPKSYVDTKFTYMLTFGGNNNNTSSQWLQYGTLRTATISNTNIATHQAIIPINSTLVWASITRTTTTGTCSLAYSINSGTAVIITPSLLPTQAQNPNPYALNSVIPANGTLGVSVLSSVLSGNCLVSFLLRSN
jgi:hypothetical protein